MPDPTCLTGFVSWLPSGAPALFVALGPRRAECLLSNCCVCLWIMLMLRNPRDRSVTSWSQRVGFPCLETCWNLQVCENKYFETLEPKAKESLGMTVDTFCLFYSAILLGSILLMFHSSIRDDLTSRSLITPVKTLFHIKSRLEFWGVGTWVNLFKSLYHPYSAHRTQGSLPWRTDKSRAHISASIIRDLRPQTRVPGEERPRTAPWYLPSGPLRPPFPDQVSTNWQKSGRIRKTATCNLSGF